MSTDSLKRFTGNVHLIKTIIQIYIYRGGGEVGYSVGPTGGRLGVRIKAATDLSRETGSDSSTAKRSALGVSATGPRR